MIAGFDISLNSTGICLYDEVKNTYQFLANINLANLTGRKVTPTWEEFLLNPPPKQSFIVRLAQTPGVFIDRHVRETGQGDGHVEMGHLRLQNVELLSDSIFKTFINHLPYRVDAKPANEKLIIALEDYSLAKITDDLIIVIETTAFLKQQLLLPCINWHKDMYPIPGGKMKKLAGNGNNDKFQMLMAFIDIKDPAVTSTPFYQFVRTNLEQIVARGPKKVSVTAPIPDMIDAFWICKYTKEIILDGGSLPEKPKIKALKAKKI